MTGVGMDFPFSDGRLGAKSPIGTGPFNSPIPPMAVGEPDYGHSMAQEATSVGKEYANKIYAAQLQQSKLHDLAMLLRQVDEMRQVAGQAQLMSIEAKLNVVVEELIVEWTNLRRGLRNGSVK